MSVFLPSENSELLSKNASARLLGLSTPKFNELPKQHPNFPKPVRLTPTGRWRYRAADLRAWVESLQPAE